MMCFTSPPHAGSQASQQPQPLTRRQAEALIAVARYINAHGYAPTMRELAAGMGLRGICTVHAHIEHLVSKGYLHKEPDISRGLTLTMQSLDWIIDRETQLAGSALAPHPVK